jgi:ring-1,2-phenylacetyl-CoA epoxidase subunit PaaC
MYDAWQAAINNVLAQANLIVKFEIGEPDDKGGRRGVHLPHLAEILNELSEVYRLEPNAAW